MNFKKFIYFFFIFIVYLFTLNISEIKIVLRIDNNIITNVDLKIESNFLKIQNPKIKTLNQNDLKNYQKFVDKTNNKKVKQINILKLKIIKSRRKISRTKLFR